MLITCCLPRLYDVEYRARLLRDVAERSDTARDTPMLSYGIRARYAEER